MKLSMNVLNSSFFVLISVFHPSHRIRIKCWIFRSKCGQQMRPILIKTDCFVMVLILFSILVMCGLSMWGVNVFFFRTKKDVTWCDCKKIGVKRRTKRKTNSTSRKKLQQFSSGRNHCVCWMWCVFATINAFNMLLSLGQPKFGSFNLDLWLWFRLPSKSHMNEDRRFARHK